KIDENSNPNNPASTLDDDNLEDLSPTLIYDPNIDYERLVCDSIYEELKGDPYIEEMMKIIRQQEDYEEDYEES
ncbi:9806_t:CDS:1, partial [Rhizophagus irregularis]